MEACTQCGIRTPGQHPFVAIMNRDDVAAHPYARVEDAIEVREQKATFDGVEKVITWLSMPMCAPCHKAPTLKAHYHERANAQTGLMRAGSNNLG
jgi:hypothetical protein